MKKILLIQPTPYDANGKLIKKKKLYFVGLAFPILAALTPEEYEVELCYETIEEVPFDTDADLIGIGSMGHAVVRTIEIAEKFKELGKTVVLGGYMVSLIPEEMEKHCDSMIIGDAEETWGELLNDFANGKLKKVYQKKLTLLKTPLPKYELLLNKSIGNIMPVQAGRGCPRACNFCSIHALYKCEYFKRDVKEVIDDIKKLKELGFKKFILLDDNIFSDREYAVQLCSEIKNLKVKWMTQCSIDVTKDLELLKIIAKSGCMTLSFGLESISQDSLNSMNKAWANPNNYAKQLKIIRSFGIDVATEMIIGADGDTLESIRETAKFISNNNIAIPRFYILTPIPGTKFHEEMKKQGRIYKHELHSYNTCEAVHIPKNMTPEELTESYWELYNEVYKLKNIIKRTLITKQLFRKPLNCLFYFLSNVYYRSQIKNRIVPNG
ncbi:MAG: B12-binding domain-containing radical SAM protein [Oscillospiraceae bacterium]|nr:B12-binding domain-containing radical SAM protein [Oscillospiraceae bacterium]